jgi:hypothetical protein
VKRVLLVGSFLMICLSACQLAPPEREPLRLLPEDRPPLPYAELLTRARIQATIATEAFYVDKWNDVDDSAQGLAQTARFLAKAQDVPPKQKETLPQMSKDLTEEATKLSAAAKDKDAKKVNESLTRINQLVRELRLDQ